MKRFAVQQRHALGWVTIATASRITTAETIMLRARSDHRQLSVRIIRI